MKPRELWVYLNSIFATLEEIDKVIDVVVRQNLVLGETIIFRARSTCPILTAPCACVCESFGMHRV